MNVDVFGITFDLKLVILPLIYIVIGIIIFEMFYSFSSFIERDKVLRKIKEKHIFPQKFNA